LRALLTDIVPEEQQAQGNALFVSKIQQLGIFVVSFSHYIISLGNDDWNRQFGWHRNGILAT